ncbi:MAG TPA: hypothetical protein VHM19_18075, partial [Polyangiales bacterium]|nr:hypothetical protein [Polyangiales bacterium]
MSESPHRSFRLLPSEQVLWQGRPKLGVPRDRMWQIVPALCFTFALVVALFAGLLAVSGIPAVRSTALLATYLLGTGCAFAFAPRYLLDPCEYLVSDRHVIWRRGQLRKVIE